MSKLKRMGVSDRVFYACIMVIAIGALIMGALSVYNLIITRTFFESSIPKELQEAAELDGC